MDILKCISALWLIIVVLGGYIALWFFNFELAAAIGLLVLVLALLCITGTAISILIDEY